MVLTGRSSFELVDELLCLLHVAVRIQDLVQPRIALLLIQKLHELLRRQIGRLLAASARSQHSQGNRGHQTSPLVSSGGASSENSPGPGEFLKMFARS